MQEDAREIRLQEHDRHTGYIDNVSLRMRHARLRTETRASHEHPAADHDGQTSLATALLVKA